MLKSSNSENVTVISTVIKPLATESLTSKIKITQNPTSWIPMAQSQRSKHLAVRMLLKKSVDKKSDGKKYYIKDMQEEKGGHRKKNTKKSHCWNYDG